VLGAGRSRLNELDWLLYAPIFGVAAAVLGGFVAWLQKEWRMRAAESKASVPGPSRDNLEEPTTMRLPGMTTRRWMIAVAVVAVIIGAETTRRRWVAYHQQAAAYAKLEEVAQRLAGGKEEEVARLNQLVEKLRQEAESVRNDPVALKNREGMIETWKSRVMFQSLDAEHSRREATYYGNLKDKYRRAASYPWLPVEADPPAPKP
jgi:hypothetical protein